MSGLIARLFRSESGLPTSRRLSLLPNGPLRRGEMGDPLSENRQRTTGVDEGAPVLLSEHSPGALDLDSSEYAPPFSFSKIRRVQ